MQAGTREAHAIDRYLAAIAPPSEDGATSRGVSPVVVERELAKLDKKLAVELRPRPRVLLIAARLRWEGKRSAAGPSPEELLELEEAFVVAVGPYSERHEIPYAAWRAVGVPARVLSRAGFVGNTRPPEPVEEAPRRHRRKTEEE